MWEQYMDWLVEQGYLIDGCYYCGKKFVPLSNKVTGCITHGTTERLYLMWDERSPRERLAEFFMEESNG